VKGKLILEMNEYQQLLCRYTNNEHLISNLKQEKVRSDNLATLSLTGKAVSAQTRCAAE
jgi:hypothetical protein